MKFIELEWVNQETGNRMMMVNLDHIISAAAHGSNPEWSWIAIDGHMPDTLVNMSYEKLRCIIQSETSVYVPHDRN